MELRTSEPDYGQRVAIVAEVLQLRDRAVASMPALDDDPPAESYLWSAGLSKLVAWLWPHRTLLERRRCALQVAAVAVALVERIDRELGGEPSADAASSEDAAPAERAPD